MQKAVLFKGSIRNNMQVAKQDATDGEIDEALAMPRIAADNTLANMVLLSFRASPICLIFNCCFVLEIYKIK